MFRPQCTHAAGFGTPRKMGDHGPCRRPGGQASFTASQSTVETTGRPATSHMSARDPFSEVACT
jgi:hypothetical protein